MSPRGRCATGRCLSRWLLQARAQLRDGVAQAALRGLAADAGRRADVLDREIAFLLQKEGFALRLGQPAQSLEQPLGGALLVDEDLERKLPCGQLCDRLLAFVLVEDPCSA